MATPRDGFSQRAHGAAKWANGQSLIHMGCAFCVPTWSITYFKNRPMINIVPLVLLSHITPRPFKTKLF